MRRFAVVSVYDMIAEKFFYFDSTLVEQVQQKRKCFVHAEAFLAISDSTADDFTQFGEGSNRPLFVAKLGADHLCHSENSEMLLTENYCLFVGARGAYKNFLCLLDATTKPEWPQWLKVKVAGSDFGYAERNLIRAKGLQDRFENVGRVTDKELGHLYSSASCFVFPSLAEGFGLPIVEAQLRGTIPVLSDIPVFREIAADFALFFDPVSPSSLARAVSQATMMHDRKTFIDQGRQHSALFRWNKTSEATLDCYAKMSRSVS